VPVKVVPLAPAKFALNRYFRSGLKNQNFFLFL